MNEISKRDLIEDLATGTLESDFYSYGVDKKITSEIMKFLGDIVAESILTPSTEITFSLPYDTEVCKLVK